MLQHITYLLLKQKNIAPCNVSYSFSNLCFVTSCVVVLFALKSQMPWAQGLLPRCAGVLACCNLQIIIQHAGTTAYPDKLWCGLETAPP